MFNWDLIAGVFLWILQKKFKKSLFTEHLQTTASGFFHSLTVLATHRVHRNQVFFYFWTCFITAFKRDECHELCIWKTTLWKKWLRCCKMGATRWDHTLLWDIAWNGIVIFWLINWLTFIYIYLQNFCTPLSCNSSLKSHRSNHKRCSIRKSVIKNFAIFTEKHLYFVDLQVCIVIKKRLQHRWFPANIAKF